MWACLHSVERLHSLRHKATVSGVVEQFEFQARSASLGSDKWIDLLQPCPRMSTHFCPSEAHLIFGKYSSTAFCAPMQGDLERQLEWYGPVLKLCQRGSKVGDSVTFAVIPECVPCVQALFVRACATQHLQNNSQTSRRRATICPSHICSQHGYGFHATPTPV